MGWGATASVCCPCRPCWLLQGCSVFHWANWWALPWAGGACKTTLNEGVLHQKPLLLTLQCIFHRCKDCFYFCCLLPMWSNKITCIQQQTLRCFSSPGVGKVLHFVSLGNWQQRMGQEGIMGFALGKPQILFLVIHVKGLLLIVKNFCTVASVMTI